ncbi:MAG: hypothetical protein QXV17_13780 [Candidatus Micrarchaeaceae archaeon]
MTKKVKIGILNSIPTPYRKPMWEAYSEIENAIFDVFYASKMHKDRKWNFDKAIGVEERFLNGRRLGKLNLEIFNLVKKSKRDYNTAIVLKMFVYNLVAMYNILNGGMHRQFSDIIWNY